MRKFAPKKYFFSYKNIDTCCHINLPFLHLVTCQLKYGKVKNNRHTWRGLTSAKTKGQANKLADCSHGGGSPPGELWPTLNFFYFLFFWIKCAGVALSDQQTPNPSVFPPVQIHPGIQIDFMTLSASHPMATSFQSCNRSQVQLMMRSFMVCATLWIIWEYVVWTDLSELNRMREDADYS